MRLGKYDERAGRDSIRRVRHVTEIAVKEFQRQHGIGADRHPDRSNYRAFVTAVPTCGAAVTPRRIGGGHGAARSRPRLCHI